MTVARMNIDVFDGVDLLSNQCFKHDLSAHSVYAGTITESNATTETAFKLDEYFPNPYWKRY